MEAIARSVREFVLPLEPSGDLDASLSSYLEEDAAALGTRLHGRIQKRLAREHPGLQCERSVSNPFQRTEFECLVRGRLDVFLPGPVPILEEIKTTFQPKALLKALDTAIEHPFAQQIRMYAWLLVQAGEPVPACRLRVVSLESYALDASLRLFQTRRDVDFLLSVPALREQLETVGSEVNLSALTREVLGMEAHSGIRQQRRYQVLLNALGKAWERVRNPAQALACFERSEQPPARERRTRILAAQEKFEEACRLALEVGEAPRDVGEERFARKFMERRRKVTPAFHAWLQAHPEPSLPSDLHLEVVPHSEGVERAALEAARAEGWEGFFAENHLWRALFGLAFWDPFFAAVPGAFQHRFQNAPLDFGRPDFYLYRQTALDQRLAELGASQDLSGELLAVADQKWGLAHAYLNWRHLQRAHLEAVLARIEPRQLAAVLRVMVRNPRAFDSGFPDLFLYRPGTAEWQLWEVKGPGDQLRPEQEFWQRTFVGLGCRAQVVRVKYRL